MEKCALKRSAERLPRLGNSTLAEPELGLEAMKMDVEGDGKRASIPKTRAAGFREINCISCSSLSAARAAKRRSLFGLAMHGHALLRRHQVTYRPGADHDAARYEPFT